MPPRDSSGKELSGAAKRRRRQLRDAPPDASNPFAAVPAPPVGEGPAAVEAWGARLGAIALEAAERGEDVVRVLWVTKTLRRLGQLKDRARHSWKAVELLRQLRGERIDLASEARPEQAVAVVAWAYNRLALALHQAATWAGAWDEEAEASLGPVAEAAASLGYLPQVQAIRELMAHLRKEAAGAGPRDR